jgi:hypothetical protein
MRVPMAAWVISLQQWTDSVAPTDIALVATNEQSSKEAQSQRVSFELCDSRR